MFALAKREQNANRVVAVCALKGAEGERAMAVMGVGRGRGGGVDHTGSFLRF